MFAGILPVVLLLAVAFWGVYESGRKFRREFGKRGVEWAVVVEGMEARNGTLIVDHMWGPQRGLGRPVVWWSERMLEAGKDLAPEVSEAAKLTKCPRKLKSKAALVARFGEGRVVEHSWGFDPALLEAGQGREANKVA